MLKVAIAPDSYKGVMTAMEAAGQIEAGLKQTLKGVACRKIPMADGGEGTVQAIVDATGGTFVKRTVADPRGRRIKATFGVSGDGKTAVMEMAAASGLALLKPRERNPLKTSTYGTGEMMKHALKLGVHKILIGIGGSATNDGGTGMARALGVKFLDARGKLVPDGGALDRIAHIDMSGLDARLRNVDVEVACDVDNPLTGRHGAAYVYAPQKGATPAMVKTLDAGLRHLADVIKRDMGIAILKTPGSGAAGGLGGGLMAFVNGELRPGVDIVIDSVKLARRIKGCDLVITGEGRMDHQTAFGKTPAGVARTAKAQGLPVVAVAGCLGKDPEAVHAIGIDAFFSSQTNNIDEEDLVKVGPGNLLHCAAQIGRLLAVNIDQPLRVR